MSIVQRLGIFAESTAVQKFVMWVIVLNAIVLGLETSDTVMDRIGGILMALDQMALVVFVAELTAKLAYRRAAFFRDGWNCFDFVVVGIALIPATGPLAVLRALRVLRLLRLLSIVPAMRSVIEGLFRALPGMGSVASLIALIFYVAAVLATNLFGATFPDWFGSLGESLYSLFQIMTLESWSMGIVRPVMEVHPSAWAFFVPFILVTTFAVLNLFIGTIVNAMQSEQNEVQAQSAAEAHDERTEMLKEMREMSGQLARMTGEVAELRRIVEAGGRGKAN